MCVDLNVSRRIALIAGAMLVMAALQSAEAAGNRPTGTSTSCVAATQPFFTASTRTLTTGTRLFAASMDSDTAQLLSMRVAAEGDVESSDWAGERATIPKTRQIVTVNTERKPVALSAPGLESMRRGWPVDQAPRSSPAVFVGAPAFRYGPQIERGTYAAFALAHKERLPMVYTADGVVHGFNAATGVEAFAFVPSPLLDHPENRSQRSFNAAPATADVYLGGAWRTVLVGGLNGAGRAIYALDVTDPRTFSTAQSHPAQLVLWELSDAQLPDLGLTYSQPVVGKLRDGTWAALFGNGYGSANGHASFYVVDMASGSVIRRFELTSPAEEDGRSLSRPNGLSTAAAVDTDGDRVIDSAYAGDLHGNLWKFDLTASVSGDWKVAFAGKPLFRARNALGQAQPILARPEVTRGPRGHGVSVLFGAGNDEASTGIPERTGHTFYAVVDADSAPTAGRASLQAQTIGPEIAVEQSKAFIRARIITAATPTDHGWYVDFGADTANSRPEERIASLPAIRDAKVIFRTQVVPSEPCAPALTWTVILDPLLGADGAELRSPLFDTNDDGRFDETDNSIKQPDGSVRVATINAVAAYTPSVAHPGPPAIVTANTDSGACVHYIYGASPTGEIQRLPISCNSRTVGRQTWRQLR